MGAEHRVEPHDEAFWRDYLTRGDAMERRVRQVFRLLPHNPRCQLCAAPFSGPGAPLMRILGKTPSEKNPRVCSSCFTFIARHHGGAEIDACFLFADIRGSTTLAERSTPSAFHALLDRFYDVATRAVVDHDGGVDKFVGDELVAFYFPLISGERYVARAIDTARALLRATGHADPAGPWAPLGVGVHSGAAWVGAVGEGDRVEITALGDAVHTAARLGAAASAGEILVSTVAAAAAGRDPALPHRSLALKGKELPTETVSLRVAPELDAG
jgi:adenylate cyclase